MIEVRDVSKRYGPVQALNRVSATFSPDEIHAVLGENGAGKSTLMAILAGFVRPDSGSVTLDGQPLPVGQPFEVRRRGVEMVHQHFTLVPEFRVDENLALARTEGGLRPAQVTEKAAPALAKGRALGWDIDPAARTGDLPVGIQQRIEILKALAGDAPVLIFDEPTAVLSPDEVDDLFRVLGDLRAQGKTVLLIAHKLSEVLRIADRVTVLRRGNWIASAPREGLEAGQLAEWMVGDLPPRTVREAKAPGAAVITATRARVKGNRGEVAVPGASFTLHRGEIVGFGGVDGNGQVELAEALVGVRPAEGITREGARAAYIPPDRQVDGLALTLSIEENLTLGGYGRAQFRQGPFLRRKELRRWSQSLIERFAIKIGTPADPARSLSGGNQQKIVVSRNLDETPDLVVAVNPTRGLDLKATAAVHEALRDCAAQGAAVALFSTDLDELAALGDRILMMSRGELNESFSAEALTGAP